MDPERYVRIMEIFGDALDRDPQDRGAWLEKACGEDAGLRLEVERLLAADADDAPLLDESPVRSVTCLFREVLSGGGVSNGEAEQGRRLGHYRLERLLGSGGMGRVHLAEDSQLGRRVALKILPAEVADDAERRARFEREARAAAALNHPGVVTVHSFEEVNGVPFMTMEYVEGDPLSRAEREGPMPLGSLLDLAVQLTDAVGAAHAVGLTHRDLKPANIMLGSDGRVKVLDFGVAKFDDDPGAGWGNRSCNRNLVDTAAGMLVGTAAYMSPEQAAGMPVDQRSDVFSLGVILFELATGKHPFRGRTQGEMLESIRNDEPASLTSIREDVPAELARIVAVCLARDPARRYPTAGELCAELRVLQRDLGSGVGAGPPVPAGNLPVLLSSFVGRERELRQLREVGRRSRLLTLTGVGGCGKTRLALRLAEDLRREHEHGAWYVELGALGDPSLVARTVAAAFGLEKEADSGAEEVLSGWLGPRNVLLVLDNCEHLVTSCASLARDLLRSCPRLRILATSREALGVEGETTWSVPSLASPSEADDPPAGEAMRYPAVRLFVERARAVRPDFVLDESTVPWVVALSRRLDGIPLAIELAAARVRLLPVRQIAERLDDSFRLLTGGSKTALPRQQTLRATMDWSHDLLREPERVLFRRLSTFVGGWTLDAAEQACAGDGLEESEVLDLLGRLVEKSLVVMDQLAGRARYRFLETVRQYALERLTSAGEAVALRGRHRDLFLAFAEEASGHLRGPEQASWLARLEAEHENLRAALVWCASDREDAGPYLRLSSALVRFWEACGHMNEGHKHLAAAIADANEATPPLLLVKAVNAAGILAYRLNDLDEARALLEKSLALREEAGNGLEVAETLNWLGNLVARQGDLDGARLLLEESRRIRIDSDDTLGVADSLNNLGFLAWRKGDLPGARALLEESLDLRREIGDTRAVAATTANLGVIARSEGDNEGARESLRESLRIFARSGARTDIALVLTHLGNIAAAMGSHRGAALLLGASEAVREELGQPETPEDKEDRERARASAAESLGRENFEVLWREGRTMSLEEAVALALRGEDEGDS